MKHLIYVIPLVVLSLFASFDTAEQVFNVVDQEQAEYQAYEASYSDLSYEVDLVSERSEFQQIDPDKLNQDTDNIVDQALPYVLALLALIDVILRFWPSTADNTILGNILTVLKFMSDRLNRFKSKP